MNPANWTGFAEDFRTADVGGDVDQDICRFTTAITEAGKRFCADDTSAVKAQLGSICIRDHAADPSSGNLEGCASNQWSIDVQSFNRS